MNSLEAIGRKARKRRKQHQLGSMREIAQVLQISVNDISEIERGIFTGSILNVERYLSYIGLELTVAESKAPTLDDLEAIFREDDD
ncbi:MAG TPA: helix-turn-helix transcriptional regulator [Saccharospirillum sp.]|nr:helix-turn-helix transcriptional regulator [Saccharospirillum sp.]